MKFSGAKIKETALLEEVDAETHYTVHPTFTKALKFWLKLGFISFGVN